MQQSVIKIYISQVTGSWWKRKAVLIRQGDELPKAVFIRPPLPSVLSGLIRPAFCQPCQKRKHTYCLCLH